LVSAEENGANIPNVKNLFTVTKVANIGSNGKIMGLWGSETYDMSIGDDGKLVLTVKNE
jgi:hypothetical protein